MLWNCHNPSEKALRELMALMSYEALGEYRRTSRNIFIQPLPGSPPGNPQYFPKLKTRSPLVASMLWARIVSYTGPERQPVANEYGLIYEKSPAEIVQTKTITTLRRSY